MGIFGRKKRTREPSPQSPLVWDPHMIPREPFGRVRPADDAPESVKEEYEERVREAEERAASAEPLDYSGWDDGS